MSPTRLSWAFAGLWLLALGSGARAEEIAPSEESVSTPWLVVGTFKGAGGRGLVGQLGTLLYEYESNDSLFRDLGDIGIGVGVDIGTTEVDWDFTFRHRVVTAHEAISPGESITAEDLSFYRTVDVSRTRLRARYDYLTDILVDNDGLGVAVEGGYSVAMARAQRLASYSDESLQEVLFATEEEGHEPEAGEEGEAAEDKHGVVYITAGSAAEVVGKLGGGLGERLSDTERAAVYWDSYSDPIMLFPEAGLPLKMRIFTSGDQTLSVGDTLTFTSFVGISPIVLGIESYGARVGYQRFWRLIRETTVVKEPDSVALVRVRNWRAQGDELTPFKLRPEVRLWVVKIGYTFFETVRDKFREKVSDAVFRIDLKKDSGMELFQRLLRTSGRVQATPALQEVEDAPGIEVVASELDRGKNQSLRVRANLFNLLRYRKTKIGTTRRIYTQDAELREVIRARSREFYKRFGRRRDVKSRSLVAIQSDVTWRDESDLEAPGEDERLAVIFSTNLSDRYATTREVAAAADGIEAMLGMSEPLPIFEEMRTEENEGPMPMFIDLKLSFGPAQIERALRRSEDELWISLGEILLGPELSDAWSTAAKRYWWRPEAPLYRGVEPPVADIARYYDRLRGYEGRPSKRSRIFRPSEYSSRELHRRAKETVAKVVRLTRILREQADCLRCLVKGYSTGEDVLLIQALVTRAAGGVERREVGYELDIQLGDMVRPLEFSNRVAHGYQLPRGAEVVAPAETIRNAAPRLRAGQMLLNVAGAEAEVSEDGASCLKLRLFSDHVFDQDLRLYLQLRHQKAGTDLAIESGFGRLGRPRDISEAVTEGEVGYVEAPGVSRRLGSEYATTTDRTATALEPWTDPFSASYEQARYFYEIRLPWIDAEHDKKGYTLLIRVVNPDGLPVSEEQQVLIKLPKDWRERVPARCVNPDAPVEAAAPGSS